MAEEDKGGQYISTTQCVSNVRATRKSKKEVERNLDTTVLDYRLQSG